jgi:hypothetical protein
MKILKNIISMKTLYKTLKIAAGFFLVAALAVSCVPDQESMGNAGQTLIKLATPTADGFKLLVLNPVSTPQSFLFVDLRKESTNAADLNTETVVTFQYDDADTTMLKAYNAINETEYVPLGPSLYTLEPAMSGGKYTFTFAPGEQAKTVKLTIPNAFNLDLGLKYAFIFKVSVTSGPGIWSTTSYDTLLTQILPKNRIDGIYTVTGTLVDAYSAGITGNYPMTVNLVTTGKNQVRFEEPADAPWGSVIFHSIQSGGAMSVYGAFGLVINFDDANNVVSVVNYYGQPAGNSRRADLDPSGVNKYDPVAKTVTLKYFMKQPSVCPDPPYTGNIRTKFDEVWTYTGPR